MSNSTETLLMRPVQFKGRTEWSSLVGLFWLVFFSGMMIPTYLMQKKCLQNPGNTHNFGSKLIACENSDQYFWQQLVDSPKTGIGVGQPLVV